MSKADIFIQMLRVTGFFPVAKTKNRYILSCSITLAHLVLLTSLAMIPIFQIYQVDQPSIAVFLGYFSYFCESFCHQSIFSALSLEMLTEIDNFSVEVASYFLHMAETFIKRKQVAKVYFHIDTILKSDHKIARLMNKRSFWYISLPIIEMILVWYYVVERKLLLMPTIILNYDSLIISMRTLQILFCVDVAKNSLTVLQDRVESLLILQRQGIVSLSYIKVKLIQFKSTYEDLLDLVAKINNCAKLSLLVYTIYNLGFTVYAFYYGFLNILKDIPVMGKGRKFLILGNYIKNDIIK